MRTPGFGLAATYGDTEDGLRHVRGRGPRSGRELGTPTAMAGSVSIIP